MVGCGKRSKGAWYGVVRGGKGAHSASRSCVLAAAREGSAGRTVSMGAVTAASRPEGGRGCSHWRVRAVTGRGASMWASMRLAEVACSGAGREAAI